MMKSLACLFSFWVALFVFVMFSFFAGATGVSAWRQLEGERLRQVDNIARLERINRDLTGEKTALLGDAETIRLRARELGYGGGEEQFVRIVGLSRVARPRHDPGQSVTVADPDHLPVQTIRLVALIAGGVTLGFLLIHQALKMLLQPPA